MTTLNSWLERQTDWLGHLYGEDNDDGTRQLRPETVQAQLVSALYDMQSGKVLPKDAAARTASLVMSQEDVSCVSNLIGMFYGAVEMFEDEKVSQVLVDYIVALASLPDAINTSSEAKMMDVGGYQMRYVQPGETMTIEGRTFWRDLPNFSMNLTERYQAPELYLVRKPEQPEIAKVKWKNVNTYVALIAGNRQAQTLPELAGAARRAVPTLAMALEHSPQTRLGVNTDLHAPAAAQWLSIAGDEVEKLCAEATNSYPAGDTWEASGGSDVVNKARLEFWRLRLIELCYGGAVSQGDHSASS